LVRAWWGFLVPLIKSPNPSTSHHAAVCRPVICSGEYLLSRSCSSTARSAKFVASFAGFGRESRWWAIACAELAS